MEWCLSIPRFHLDKLESSMRPNCFCSSIFATTIPLNNFSGLLSWVRLKFQFPLRCSLMYDVKTVFQIICRYIRILYYGKPMVLSANKLYFIFLSW